MFQVKTGLNASDYNENNNRKKKHKKTHISCKRKHHSKHRKKWDSNLNKPHLKHVKYTSDYIGPERLTKNLLGFLGKGKMSDSISRLEKIMPENCKARSKHDLDRILNASSHEIHSYNQDYLPHAREHCNSSRDGSNSSSPVPESQRIQHESTSTNSRVQKSNFSANLHADNSITSPSPLCYKYDETSICRESITKKLHCAVSNANKTAFPNISNQNRLVKELLDLKTRYNSCRKSLSSSNDCESSQSTKNIGSCESLEKEDFQLNPILTQESPVAKSIENMFPNSRELNSNSDDDSITSDDSISLLTNDIPMSRDHDDTKMSVASSGIEGSLTLIPSSPTSSSGSPVWVPEISPMKFLPDCLPTPKLFYRQKMF